MDGSHTEDGSVVLIHARGTFNWDVNKSICISMISYLLLLFYDFFVIIY